MTVTYKPDIAGTNKLMNGPEMQVMLRSAAEKGKAFAESISPHPPGRSGHATGEYAASFEVTVKAHGGVHGDRAEATLTNTSPHAGHVEWQDGYHVLARTADYIQATGP